MSIARHHTEWLSLVPVSGPFLSLPVLMEAFNTGLEPHDPDQSRLLRQEYARWQDAVEKRKADPAPHQQWIKFVLTQTLELDAKVLLEGQVIPQTLQAEIPEHHELLRPNIVVIDPGTKKPRMLVQTYPPGQPLTSYVTGSPWKASPDTRMTELLHGTGVRLGLVTNGEHWMLVDAPKGETTGYASWYAETWQDEPITLRAFRSLLSASRFFSVSDDQTLESLLTKSSSNQQEVTDQLGYQVRRAVEVLIHSLDRADQDFGRELLADVMPEQLYESALTVMMRLVFLFCAEERELIPSKPFPVYEQNYSVSTISKQLRELADQHGEELLERRYDAWPRLLAAFRAVYGGLKHDDLHIPAYGGNLFNPDRFPFLEGRKRGTSWKESEANPLPVNNRTVLHLLEALQLLQIRMPGGGPAEARRLSFRALDIEQIGHVYEGLLDHTAKRAAEPFLGLIGTRDREPEFPLAKLEELLAKGEAGLIKFLKEETGKSESALKKAIKAELDTQDVARFRTACQSDDALWKRVKPFAGVARQDNFGYPVVIPKGSVFVTSGTDRRSSGTHYTPRSLTEPIVQYTLEPLVYVGPAEGLPKSDWKLKSAKELLSLKICDMACGSGAFLVQAARYMAERLLEAWEAAKSEGIGARDERKEERDAALPGTDSLAEVDGTGEALLSGDEKVSQGRVIRDGESDQTSSSLDSSEHRRGKRSGAHQGVPELREHRTGLAGGSGDASDPEQRGGTAETVRLGSLPFFVGRDQPNASGPEKVTGKTPLTSPLILSPSSLAPQITPDGRPAVGALDEELVPTDPAEQKTYAMRIIAQRCLYGVDINPLAAEMAKLSLWLLTLAKDKPFEFLDHSIRCGDSLVGLHSIDQLKYFCLKPEGDDEAKFFGPLLGGVEEAINLRLKIEDLPANSVEDIERQEKLLREANEKIVRLRCAADLLVAGEFWGEGSKDKQEKVRHAAVKAGYYLEKGPTEEFEQVAAKERRGQKMFHWPLEFPEVIVKRGGFDSFVCNPPFQGGSRLVEQAGDSYATFLAESRDKLTKKTDLCCHFFRRSHELLHDGGALGMIATNSVTQGASRKGSLDVLLADGRPICFALSSFSWPGAASLSVAVILFGPKRYRSKALLDWQYVESIDGLLDVSLGKPPVRLIDNDDTCYLGVHLGGTSRFVVTPEQATDWIASDPQNAEVLFPFIGGDEIGQTPLLDPARWIISFGERRLEDAEHFLLPFQHLVEFVKPERAKKNEKKYPRLVNQWWKFWHSRNELYHDLQSLQRVIVRTRTTGNHGVQQVRFSPSNWVHTDGVIVFKLQNWCDLAVLQSSFHGIWAQRYSSSHNTGPRYIPTDCFGTFPRPAASPHSCQQEAQAFDELRTRLMQDRQIGVTGISNLLHDEANFDIDIVQLRQLFTSLDESVRNAYGWDDIQLSHGFHDTRYGRHFTVAASARVAILTRLVDLNRERARSQEAMSGECGSVVKRDTKRKGAVKSADYEATLFDMDEDDE